MERQWVTTDKEVEDDGDYDGTNACLLGGVKTRGREGVGG